MSFYTEQAKSFKFPALPGTNHDKKKEAAFVHGFVSSIIQAQLSPHEKVAWLKYAAEMPPGGPGGAPGGGPPIQPVEGPGPGFVPEQGGAPGGEPGGEGGDVSPEQLQQIIASLPGNSLEEKLHNAAMALANMQHEGQEGPDQEGAEQGGPDGGVGGIDPALLQHLMSGAGGPGGPGNPGGPGGPQ